MRQLFAFILILFIYQCGLSQCPGSFTCEGASVQCSAASLNGMRCSSNTAPNAHFPESTLCFGSGVPENLVWWAFITEGGPYTVNINYELASCSLGNGLEAGLFERSCDGGLVIDCDANCTGNSLIFSAVSDPCQAVYLWVDGCGQDICDFTLSFSGNVGPPQLPNPLAPIKRSDGDGACPSASLYIDWSSECEPTFEWTVDGIPYGRGWEKSVDFSDERDYEVCYTVYIGNPDIPASICAQATRCQTFRPQVEQKLGSIRRLCTSAQAFLWHGLTIDQSCVNPPCTARVIDIEGCLVDSIRAFQILPPELRIGKKRNLILDQIPFVWHNQVITSSCINPPCSARVELSNGCLVDSLVQFEILFLPKDTAQLKGHVYNDLNNNCIKDPGEPPLRNIQITVDDGQNVIQTLTNTSGYYDVLLPAGTYEIRALDLSDSLFACPIPTQIEVIKTDSIYCQDFFKFPANCYPGRLHILPLRARNRLRCDPVNRSISVQAFNTSHDILPSENIIVRVDSLFNFINANLPFQLNNAQEIEVTLPDIDAGSSIEFEILFESDCNRDNVLDDVCFSAVYVNGYQCNGRELKSTSCETILNSFDPNDLRITPHGRTPARYITKTGQLNGIIRFHNSGTDTAYDIRVELELDWTRLDKTSIQLISSSEEDIIMNVGDSSVCFVLPDAKLPHDAIDSVNSHGFIKYRVRPHPNIEEWWMIIQQAFIYFDFNDAIETNIERQIIAGEFLVKNQEVLVCEGDTFNTIKITRDTVLSDTVLNDFSKQIINYHITALPSYQFDIDTLILAGNEFLGHRIYMDTTMIQSFVTKEGCDSSYYYHIETLTTSVSSPDNLIKLYPNPAFGNVIFIEKRSEVTGFLDLIDSSGKKITYQLTGSNKQTVHLGTVKPGLYYYHVRLNDKSSLAGRILILKD